MSYMLSILRINDIVIPCLSILSNILLLWLIKNVQTKTLKHIRFVLIPHIIGDIILSIFFFVVAPHIFDVEGNVYIVYGNMFNIFGFFEAWILFPIFAAFTLTCMSSISVSFYLRYLVVCKNKVITKKDLILPYSLLILLYFIYFGLFHWCYRPINEVKNEFNPVSLIKFWYEHFGRNPVYVAGKLRSLPLLVSCAFMLSSLSWNYSLIFYYSRKITKMLSTHSSSFITTKIIHKQIHFALIIQAFAPSVIGSVGFLLFVIEVYAEMQNYELSLCLSLFYTWMLITNPIAAILIIKPYRIKVKKLLILMFMLLKCKKQETTYSMSATNLNSTTHRFYSGWIH